ncbi:hypothetical protein [Methylobacterium sp. J-068]|uniref:hypothetical protein n=1 Tax=Methylobacterium sp. J-068 TaxID=2836649 RepID=UPI001FB8D2CB|nr:hypothetical protein [Methylobacterium sp. J-068]MCJ2035347.1 hypothetical protein [Methylobacterium sp. J-068]
MRAASGQALGTAGSEQSALLLGWRRYVPEAIGLVLFLVLVDHLYFDGTRFAWIAPRPFWIPIILISAQYGLAGGVFATLASTLALYSSALPSQLATQDYYAYSRLVVAEPTAWLACALVLGGLRSLHIFHAAELRQQRDDALQEGEILGRGLSDAMAEIARLELRIASETQTLGAVAQAFGRLDAGDAPRPAASLAELGRLLIGASAITLYGHGPEGFAALAVAGDGASRDHVGIPPLDDGTVQALRQTPDLVWRRDRVADAERMPAGAILAIGIPAPDRSGPLGLILVERLLPSRTLAAAAAQARDVARGVAGLLGRVER